MKIITIASVKGGVGKTATVTFLAQALHSKGLKVLVIDSDANNNLTDYYLRDTPVEEIEVRNLYHLITGELSAEDVIFKGAIDIIPCTLELHTIGLRMASKPTGIMHFQRSIRDLDYDFIIIDAPPALGYEMNNALFASDIVLVPANLTRWTLQAIQLVNRTVEEMKADGKKFTMIKSIPSIVTEKENESLQALSKNFTKTYIKKMNAIKTAQDKAVWLKDDSPVLEFYKKLAEEII